MFLKNLREGTMKKKTQTFITLAMAVALVLSACAQQQATPAPVEQSNIPTESVVAEGKLKPVHAANLSFQVRGSVDQINVKIGDKVEKGEVLARLANFDIANAQLTAAKLEFVQAQYALDTLNRTGDGNRAAAWTAYQNAQIARADAQKKWDDVNPTAIQKRVDDQQATVNDLEKTLSDAQDEFDKFKELDTQNSKRTDAENKLRTAQKNYDDAVAELESIQHEMDGARAVLDSAIAAEAESKHQYELSSGGANSDQLALAQTRLDNAKAQVAAAQATLDNYQITAPFDGIVADVNVEVGEQVGSDVRAVSVIDTSSWMVETTDVTELEVVKLSVGQKVTFTADALPDMTMTGTVTEISQSSYTSSGDVIYTVRIAVDKVDARVKWGMTVEVIFAPNQ